MGLFKGGVMPFMEFGLSLGLHVPPGHFNKYKTFKEHPSDEGVWCGRGKRQAGTKS